MLPLQVRIDLEAMAMKGILHILQSFGITRASPSDCSVLYPGHQFVGRGGSYSSAEMQSVYSTAPADWFL